MSQFQTIFSQTQKIINYNSIINDKTNLKPYRTNRIHPDMHSESPSLKKFHQYFGKIKPSLYQQLKNIFENAVMTDRTPSPQPDYHIQGMVLTSRAKHAKRTKQLRELSPIGNNYLTIQSLNSRDIYRKAKLNKLIVYQQNPQQPQLNQEVANQLVQQSSQLLNDLKQKIREHRKSKNISRSFRVSKNTIEKQTFLQYINPNNKQIFTRIDLNQILCMLHHVDIQISLNISYFNVYVQEGNNSQLLKSLIRKRHGWRVVELPIVANLIWTQFYRRSLLKKRLHRRQKSQNDEQKDKIAKAESLKRNNKIFTGDKRYESIKNELSPLKAKSNDPTFNSQVRKLVPQTQAEDITKMKRSLMKSLKPIQITHNVLVHNHFPYNSCISDKKNLLTHLTRYLQSNKKNVFQYVPESYQLNDMSHKIIQTLENQNQNLKQYWIIKPGENSNRGRGITISHNKNQTIEELKKRLNEQPDQRQNIAQRKKRKSVILQKYIKPLLYYGRKFDIRSYMLVTFLNNQLRMYCYEQCYIRTSSKIFDIDSTNKLVHLTNDAIQSYSPDYGKFQQGNKLSELTFSKYIDDEYHKKHNDESIWQNLKLQMQDRCIDVIQSSYQNLLKGLKKQQDHSTNVQSEQSYYFELFGMDFMIDEQYKLWLIEVNTNPAITNDCSRVLNHLIPKMLDNVFTIAIQPIMRPLRLHDWAYTNRFVSVYKKIII